MSSKSYNRNNHKNRNSFGCASSILEDENDFDFVCSQYESTDDEDEFEEIDTEAVEKKPKKNFKTIDSIDYFHVTDESARILEESEREEEVKKENLFCIDAKSGKRKTQAEVDREIVDSFYENPTPERFTLLWKRFYYGVHSHAYNIMGDWERAEDMVQETFQRAWLKRDNYDRTKSNYSTWLYTICRNVCATSLRKERNEKCVDLDVNDIFNNVLYGENCEKALSDEVYLTLDSKGDIKNNSFEDITKQLYDASIIEISKSDPLFQKIIYMKDIANMTMREIAIRLEINESKVKNVYYKCRGLLCDIMKRKYKDLYATYKEASHDKDESENPLTPYKSNSLHDDEYLSAM